MNTLRNESLPEQFSNEDRRYIASLKNKDPEKEMNRLLDEQDKWSESNLSTKSFLLAQTEHQLKLLEMYLEGLQNGKDISDTISTPRADVHNRIDSLLNNNERDTLRKTLIAGLQNAGMSPIALGKNGTISFETSTLLELLKDPAFDPTSELLPRIDVRIQSEDGTQSVVESLDAGKAIALHQKLQNAITGLDMVKLRKSISQGFTRSREITNKNSPYEKEDPNHAVFSKLHEYLSRFKNN